MTARITTHCPASTILSDVFIQAGRPNQNAFIERLNRGFRQEVLSAWLFKAVSDVQGTADAWLTDYTEYQPDDSLGSIPPTVFRPRVFNPPPQTTDMRLGRTRAS